MNKMKIAFRLIILYATLQLAASEEYAKDTLQAEYGEIIYAGLVSFSSRIFFPTVKCWLATM